MNNDETPPVKPQEVITVPVIKNVPEIDFKTYKITPKFEEWRRLYLDKSNKETFGNATRSALKAYNLDEKTQYGVAGQIGYENLMKHDNLKTIVRDYMTDNGFTLPVLINHALQKLADPRITHTDWWKEVMLMAGYRNEDKVNPASLTQINVADGNTITFVNFKNESERQ